MTGILGLIIMIAIASALGLRAAAQERRADQHKSKSEDS